MLVELPDWIDPKYDDDFNDHSYLKDLMYGGCASGVYMPAVTYHTALETMSEHGDEVLQYIEDWTGELPAPSRGESWAGMAVFYLSTAVELFASNALVTLEDENDESEDED